MQSINDLINQNKALLDKVNTMLSNNFELKSKDFQNTNYYNKDEFVNEFNIEQYKEKEILNIRINKNEWYNNKEEIKITPQKIVCKRLERPQYISYIEKNCKFTLPPKNNIIKINNTNQYTVKFNAKGEILHNISLYIITYDDTKKIGMEQIKPNEKKQISISKDVKSIRLAIKFNDVSIVDLEHTEIVLLEKKKLEFLDFKSYRKLGFDKVKDLKKLKVACIFDPFTMQCFEDEVNLITFTPENWKAIFEFNRPHILMVESAWKGNNGTWTGRIANNKGKNNQELLEIIDWCKTNEIPTVFWNKEDPVHYDVFIDTAKHFDYIFTTNKECIEVYQKQLNRNNIYVLPFAAQPKLHNPTELLSSRKNGICFAGSYYRHKYEHRAKDTKTLLDVCIPYNLEIYDRNYNLNLENYKFPDEYQPYVKGVLVGKDIIKSNKGYKVVLNLNTVKDSTTMFARRVFELLASNTPVLSNYSPGIQKLFNGIVVADDNKEILETEIRKLMTDEEYYLNKRIKGLREVYLNHTYEHRILDICEKVGINIESNKEKILIISKVNEASEILKINSILDKQEFRHYEITYITDNLELIQMYPNCTNDIETVDITKYNFITYMSHKDYYGKYYLTDLFLARKYTDKDIIGKRTIYQEQLNEIKLLHHGEEYTVCSDININSMMIRLDSVFELSNTEILQIFEGNSHIMNRLTKYSIDRFNYIKDYGGQLLHTVEK